MIAYNGHLSGLTKVHYGGNNISMVYYGSHKVFPDETPPTGTKFFATYQDGSTYGVDCDGDSTLTSATTRNGGIIFRFMTTAVIGNCVTSIDMDCFTGFVRLTSVTIPNSVTSIGKYAFYSCSGLTSCTIGSGVTTIGDSALNNCSGLTSITVLSTIPPTLGIRTFNNTNNCPIYVPATSVDAYKSALNWSSYASRIRAIQ